MSESIGDKSIHPWSHRDGPGSEGETYRMALIQSIAGGVSSNMSNNIFKGIKQGENPISLTLDAIETTAQLSIAFADKIIEELDKEDE